MIRTRDGKKRGGKTRREAGATHDGESPSPSQAALRQLATRAMGLTGADIERIVREARLKARREKRPLRYDDLEAGIRGHRAPMPHDLRWRYAVHEAGHAVVHHVLRLGAVKGLTIDTTEGGHNTLAFSNRGTDTPDWYRRMLAMLLAGRAAELVVLGNAGSGSGGAEQSDLARATRIALDMEQTLGFGGKFPLLYLDHRDAAAALSRDGDLAGRVHRRLEMAQAMATEVILGNRAVYDRLVRRLFDAHALDEADVLDILMPPGGSEAVMTVGGSTIGEDWR